MMATAAVIGLSAGKRLVRSSLFYSSDLPEKPFPAPGYRLPQSSSLATKSVILADKSSHFGPKLPSNRPKHAIKALKEDVPVCTSPSAPDVWFQEAGATDISSESSLEAIILLQKSMLEKQWKLSFDGIATEVASGESCRKTKVTRSGVSARQRRANCRKKYPHQNASVVSFNKSKQFRSRVSPEFLQSRFKGYVRGRVSEDLLTHAEVVSLSKKIKAGLSLEEQKVKLKEKLGFEPSDKQLASSLRISRAELHAILMEFSLAREKLAMSNIRLVMSIAQKYDNLGAEMADLVQGGLIALLRGIEKFDSSKGYRISTYVYWWIRQGVSRALVENSRTLRLPVHLHERLSSIRNAKIRLEEKGIAPSLDKIADSLNMSQKKVRNATEAVVKVISLDKEAFPTLNGLPGETLHSYVPDNKLENNPWIGFEEWSLKDEVNKLLHATLGKREREIIRLYYGLDEECHTWEDISRQFGLSRERVRQVGLVAMEKLKHAARKRHLEAMFVKH